MLAWRIRRRGNGKQPICSGGGARLDRSDTIDDLFWIDDEGPVAGVVLTDWGEAWGCEPIVVPGLSTASLPTVWERAVEAVDTLGLEAVDVLVRDDDVELLGLLGDAGFVRDDDRIDGVTWMDAEDRPAVAALPEGFVLVDRARETGAGPHPHAATKRRGGRGPPPAKCSLYRPDARLLAVEALR